MLLDLDKKFILALKRCFLVTSVHRSLSITEACSGNAIRQCSTIKAGPEAIPIGLIGSAVNPTRASLQHCEHY